MTGALTVLTPPAPAAASRTGAGHGSSSIADVDATPFAAHLDAAHAEHAARAGRPASERSARGDRPVRDDLGSSVSRRPGAPTTANARSGARPEPKDDTATDGPDAAPTPVVLQTPAPAPVPTPVTPAPTPVAPTPAPVGLALPGLVPASGASAPAPAPASAPAAPDAASPLALPDDVSLGQSTKSAGPTGSALTDSVHPRGSASATGAIGGARAGGMPSAMARAGSRLAAQAATTSDDRAQAEASVVVPGATSAATMGADPTTPREAARPSDAAIAPTALPVAAPTVLPVAGPTAPAAPADAPTPAGSTAPETPLNTQLAPSIVRLQQAAPGEHVVTVAVTPENLGPVTVRAHVGPDGVRVELLAPTDEARRALSAMLPDLRRDLAQGALGTSVQIAPASASSGSGGAGSGSGAQAGQSGAGGSQPGIGAGAGQPGQPGAGQQQDPGAQPGARGGTDLGAGSGSRRDGPRSQPARLGGVASAGAATASRPLTVPTTGLDVLA